MQTNATPTGRSANRRVVVVIARRTDVSRNLNANPQASAFTFARVPDAQALDPEVVQVRKPDGGLLFSNEPGALPLTN